MRFDITTACSCSLMTALMLAGCVAGPDDFAAKSSEDDRNFDVVSPSGDPAANQQTVSLVSAEERGDFRATPSGLKYRIIKEGKGRKPNRNSTVTCHYRGWLDDGTEFDSSYRSGRAATFPLSGVIKGWTEGLQLVQEGGAIELEIPSDLGYGPQGSPPTIPGGATLHFEVELIKVN
ncbi:FKBP-type peptidyl-prolyl cis-trans isomerase [Thalassoglobus sp. JC818]|uniref:FKBP-type peptidyl-prolyl cis-trans isomerase n=1 Tax=Thalassoglobus sp. JC818 TaxID=3232136 RepID=UPI003459F1C6